MAPRRVATLVDSTAEWDGKMPPFTANAPHSLAVLTRRTRMKPESRKGLDPRGCDPYGQPVNQAVQPGPLLGQSLLKTEPAGSGDHPAPAAEAVLAAHAVGIDIECCDSLPVAEDPRLDPFYVENFTGAEIAYCARQPEPKLSFCGLWSAKEAAIKCGHALAGLRPIDIEILHDDKGRPRLRFGKEGPQAVADLWRVSISQTGNTCVAVCLKEPQPI
jgi:phosphopantetheine--protein transferase-like protein